MENKITNKHIKLEPTDNERLINLCGLLDKNIRQIESFFAVEISNRGNAFKISGEKDSVTNTTNFLKKMYTISEKEEITSKQLHLYLNNSGEFLITQDDDIFTEIILKKRE